MSYDIRIRNAKTNETIELKSEHNINGGTYCASGTNEAWLNITYNYYSYFREAFGSEDGIRIIYDMNVKDSIDVLKNAINYLNLNYNNPNPSNDYWEACPGNAKAAIYDLLKLATFAIKDYPYDELSWIGD